MTTDNLPADWDFEQNRSEFVKWLNALSRLIAAGPTNWVLWQQAREAQEILCQLSKRLGFNYGPIERRDETFEVAGENGDELHERHYVVATDPHSTSVAERFDGWVWRGTSGKGMRGGMPDAEFGQEVLRRLDLWLSVATNLKSPERREQT